jgi:hypothetical protein
MKDEPDFEFDEEVKKRFESGEFDTPKERILRRLCQKPEILERLIKSLQEEPVPWEDEIVE